MHKGAWCEGQKREHEQRRGVKAVHPLLSFFQFGGAGGELPEEALDYPPPEQEHDAAAQCHTGPAVQKAQQAAVGRHIQRHNGDQRQRREKRLHHGQHDGGNGAKVAKTVQ